MLLSLDELLESLLLVLALLVESPNCWFCA